MKVAYQIASVGAHAGQAEVRVVVDGEIEDAIVVKVQEAHHDIKPARGQVLPWVTIDATKSSVPVALDQLSWLRGAGYRIAMEISGAWPVTPCYDGLRDMLRNQDFMEWGSCMDDGEAWQRLVREEPEAALPAFPVDYLVLEDPAMDGECRQSLAHELRLTYDAEGFRAERVKRKGWPHWYNWAIFALHRVIQVRSGSSSAVWEAAHAYALQHPDWRVAGMTPRGV